MMKKKFKKNYLKSLKDVVIIVLSTNYIQSINYSFMFLNDNKKKRKKNDIKK